MQTEATGEEINYLVTLAKDAFSVYKKSTLQQRADLLRAIALQIELLGDDLLHIANDETNLSLSRLRAERIRTIFQLKSYASHCEQGHWLEARIDTGNNKRDPPKPDIRKTLVPLGPVVVFGSSNFPFAYSTAGGDTACALAAGCTVLVKAHHAHLRTGKMVADAIQKALHTCNLPEGIFNHVIGKSNYVGEMLVKHPLVKAVAFTGSFEGGKQLFDWGQQRHEPIPVFAEMGSVNPIFILPEKLKEEAAKMADMLAASITLGVGQFCTNPGIIVGIKSDALNIFMQQLAQKIRQTDPSYMLHEGIFKMYEEKKKIALAHPGVETIAHSKIAFTVGQGEAVLAKTTAKYFQLHPLLQEEVFGPYSIIIECENEQEMVAVAQDLKGQLTATLMCTETEIHLHQSLKETLEEKCGRFIWNGVPTGVEVCLSMQHGGPYPATTDSRFTSVGADGIKRFARPIAFQNWPDDLLPMELKNENPSHIWRMINDGWTNLHVQ